MSEVMLELYVKEIYKIQGLLTTKEFQESYQQVSRIMSQQELN